MSKMPVTTLLDAQVDLVRLDETAAPTPRIFSMLIAGGIVFWVGLGALLAWML